MSFHSPQHRPPDPDDDLRSLSLNDPHDGAATPRHSSDGNRSAEYMSTKDLEASAADAINALDDKPILVPEILVPHAAGDTSTDIAPWINALELPPGVTASYQPSPSPTPSNYPGHSASPSNSSRIFPKPSFTSSFARQTSSSSRSAAPSLRASDTHSIADSTFSSNTWDASTLVSSGIGSPSLLSVNSASPPHDGRSKSKSSFFGILRKSRSRSRLTGADSDRLAPPGSGAGSGGLHGHHHALGSASTLTISPPPDADFFNAARHIVEPPPPPLPKKDLKDFRELKDRELAKESAKEKEGSPAAGASSSKLRAVRKKDKPPKERDKEKDKEEKDKSGVSPAPGNGLGDDEDARRSPPPPKATGTTGTITATASGHGVTIDTDFGSMDGIVHPYAMQLQNQSKRSHAPSHSTHSHRSRSTSDSFSVCDDAYDASACCTDDLPPGAGRAAALGAGAGDGTGTSTGTAEGSGGTSSHSHSQHSLPLPSPPLALFAHANPFSRHGPALPPRAPFSEAFDLRKVSPRTVLGTVARGGRGGRLSSSMDDSEIGLGLGMAGLGAGLGAGAGAGTDSSWMPPDSWGVDPAEWGVDDGELGGGSEDDYEYDEDDFVSVNVPQRRSIDGSPLSYGGGGTGGGTGGGGAGARELVLDAHGQAAAKRRSRRRTARSIVFNPASFAAEGLGASVPGAGSKAGEAPEPGAAGSPPLDNSQDLAPRGSGAGAGVGHGRQASVSVGHGGVGGGVGAATAAAGGGQGTGGGEKEDKQEKHKVVIWRSDGGHHVVPVSMGVSCAQFVAKLEKKFFHGEPHVAHRLYLKERGKERILTPSEKPGSIIRRRLDQAGYDKSDTPDWSEDMSFLMKFVYKSRLIEKQGEELSFEDGFEGVDLTGCGLDLIPIVLHQNAGFIIYLNLSRNPMVDIPLDFIQSCTTLRELRLTHMALKKVPQSIRYSATLQRIHLNCNRIADLDEAGLDRIPELTSVNLQNNRIEQLPWYFPRLRALKYLDISNNKFSRFPMVLCEMQGLVDLDVSFNMLTELPDELGNLSGLQRLVIVGNQVQKIPAGCAGLVSLTYFDCRRNNIPDISPIYTLPKLENLYAAHNHIHAFDMSFGPSLTRLDVSWNDITNVKLILRPGAGVQHAEYALTVLDLSHAKLSSLDDFALSQLHSLKHLDLSHNSFRALPDALGELEHLTSLAITDNQLDALPGTIGQLQRLRVLDVHNNSLKELPAALWSCASLVTLNVTSNLVTGWADPPGSALVPAPSPSAGGTALDAPPSPPPRTAANGYPVNGGLAIPGAATGRKASNAGSFVLVGTPPNSAGSGGSSLSVSGRMTPTLSSSAPMSTPNLTPGGGPAPGSARPLPPLARSLRRLYLGENRLTDDALPSLVGLRELRVLNLSFNDIQDMPASFLRNMTQLEELYLSGNQLTSIPTEDLARLTKLSVLYLNGNRFQTLPQELGKVQSLTVIDAGSNQLRYNINNWEFDWNWNFNKTLMYLNLSGNKRLEIKPESSSSARFLRSEVEAEQRRVLSDFSELDQLRILGLMDVTTAFLSNPPEEGEDRRVRTTLSEVNRMSYGIADMLGKNGYLNMFDLVQPEFRGRKSEAVFAMFGRTHAPKENNSISRWLHDRFVPTFSAQLAETEDARAAGRDRGGVTDALRRAFLRLNKDLYDELYGTRTGRKMSQASTGTGGVVPGPASTIGGGAAAAAGGGGGGLPAAGAGGMGPSGAPGGVEAAYARAGASGIVLYIVERTLYVANVGSALAVLSRQGSAELISRKHDPFDRGETARIRAAEGWISPKGMVHDVIGVSRSFGFYHEFPVINARPDVIRREISEGDEFVIVANSGLWDYISYQTAVDIARGEEPMIAAQKLRDFAISYGADGSTMIMVIRVGDLFVTRLPTDVLGANGYSKKRSGKKPDIADRTIARLDGEVEAPTGHLALVFTDIRNSTQLWDTNAGMPTAMRLHNNLLRRHLRLCGGYLVKTEGDAFMCSFPTTLAAVWWCLTIQSLLLHEPWPHEILECEEGKELYDAEGKLVARGLSVRMGLHCGMPVCEPDPITDRMDYFGPMTIRAARISGHAAGGQIMCSADVVREISARVTMDGPETDYSEFQPKEAIDAIQRMGIEVIPVGEIKLKGLEVPEKVSLLYPRDLIGRLDMAACAPLPQPAKLATECDDTSLSVETCLAEVRRLASICLRLEALCAGHILPRPADKDGLAGDPSLLLPHLSDKSTQEELLAHLDSLSVRAANAVTALGFHQLSDQSGTILGGLQQNDALDPRLLRLLSSLLAPR